MATLDREGHREIGADGGFLIIIEVAIAELVIEHGVHGEIRARCRIVFGDEDASWPEGGRSVTTALIP